MRVLSISQPWATLIVLGAKRFEVRSWKTPFRGRIAIHASSKAIPGWVWEERDDDPVFAQILSDNGLDEKAMRSLPRSAVVGTVELKDIHPFHEVRHELTDRDWPTVGNPDGSMFLWRLRSPLRLPPVPIHGKLNLWTLPPDVAARVAAADGG